MNATSYIFLAIMVAVGIPYIAFWVRAGKKKKLEEMKKKEEQKNNNS